MKSDQICAYGKFILNFLVCQTSNSPWWLRWLTEGWVQRWAPPPPPPLAGPGSQQWWQLEPREGGETGLRNAIQSIYTYTHVCDILVKSELTGSSAGTDMAASTATADSVTTKSSAMVSGVTGSAAATSGSTTGATGAASAWKQDNEKAF